MIHMALLSASMVTVRYRFTCRVEVATVNIVGQRLTAKRRSVERDLPSPAATQQAIGSEHSLQLLTAISSRVAAGNSLCSCESPMNQRPRQIPVFAHDDSFVSPGRIG
jgi:hypothetical protein